MATGALPSGTRVTGPTTAPNFSLGLAAPDPVNDDDDAAAATRAIRRCGTG
jgi:hypothetical protein